MLKLSLQDVSKAYINQWIIKDYSLEWEQGQSYAITGPNGAGKSTLTALLMGLTLPTKGTVEYTLDGKKLDPEYWYQYLTLAAPYQELIEEYTLQELLQFHFQFKKPVNGMKPKEIMEAMYLEDARNKQVRFFSSGMKQRLKLGLAFFSESHALFLDEPTSNLDERAKGWYHDQLKKVSKNRLLVIASNEPEEYKMCHQSVTLH